MARNKAQVNVERFLAPSPASTGARRAFTGSGEGTLAGGESAGVRPPGRAGTCRSEVAAFHTDSWF